MIRTYKCRTRISGAGHERLGEIFKLSAELYNAGLESRIDCYRKAGKGRSFFDQCRELTEVRAELREFEEVSAIVFRGVLSRLDKAYKRFFKYGGFPRFKSSGRYRTIEINDQCWRMLKREGQKLVLKAKGLPRIEVKKELSVRVHRCDCGVVLDRDVNAAINILHRGISVAGGKLRQSRMVGRIGEKQDSGLVRPATVCVQQCI